MSLLYYTCRQVATKVALAYKEKFRIVFIPPPFTGGVYFYGHSEEGKLQNIINFMSSKSKKVNFLFIF